MNEKDFFSADRADVTENRNVGIYSTDCIYCVHNMLEPYLSLLEGGMKQGE